MKKPFLLLLSFIPLLASCNNSGAFPNPFDDKYTKIGFKIDESNEKITRPLTTDETNLVLDTIKDTTINSKIFSMNGKRETRDYAKAFAGEFKQGYNVSNIMKSESYNTSRQDESVPEPTKETEYTKKRRTKIHNKSTTISQYSYGQIQEEVTQDDYYHFAKEKVKETDMGEAINVSSSYSFNLRSKKIENDKYETISDKIQIIKDPSDAYDDEELKKYLYLDQSKYVFTPDAKCGANANGEIILTAAVQSNHIDSETGEKGVYSLKDGRKYQAMDNSLTVSKLVTIKEDDNKWCLVSYVRIYKETVITSEVIQPNVPVTKLSNPITISYSEEINHFSQNKVAIDGELPGETK